MKLLLLPILIACFCQGAYTQVSEQDKENENEHLPDVLVQDTGKIALMIYENEIVITASKLPEKILTAPASISVIGREQIEKFAGSNIGELISTVQGIEFTRYGVDGITFNARGGNSAFNNKVFQIVDGRNSMAALSGSLPVFNNGSTIKEDIERLEIVLGPQTALYGPNALNAVFNTVTKDPRKYAGTILSLSAGNRYQFSGRLRQAGKINNHWAYKLTGEYATGKDFTFNDSIYAGNQPPGLRPFFGPAVSIPERNVDLTFRHIRGEAHLYYSLSSKSDIIVSGGSAMNDFLQTQTGGRNQMRGFSYSFLQAKLVHPRFFVNVYNTWGSIGNSYNIGNYTRDYWNSTQSTLSEGPFRKLSPDSAEINALRLGNTFKEESSRMNSEVQYNYYFHNAGVILIAGLNYQQERPNGFGINLVDSFNRIVVSQHGAVLKLEKTLPWHLRLIGALRYDNHSNFGSFFTPRIGLTKGLGNGVVRITWGSAYAMPTILNQYAGIANNLFGNGAGIDYIPNGSNPADPTSLVTTVSLKPESVKTWELGYKGNPSRKLYIDVSGYFGQSINFISPPRSVSGRVLRVNGIPVTHNPNVAGAVINDKLENASFLTHFNYGKVHSYGIDAGVTYAFTDDIHLSVKYSWFGSDITKDNVQNDANKDGFVSLEEKSLNAPQNRVIAMLSFARVFHERLHFNLATRYLDEYDFYSGAQIGTAAGKGSRGKIERPGQPPLLKNFDWGPLGGFTTFDVSTGYQLSYNVSLNVGITNLYNTQQFEMVGSPSIGRLIMAEIRVNIP